MPICSGVERPVTPTLVAAVVTVMGDAYPDLARNEDYVIGVAAREEGRFRATLRSGLTMLEAELAGGDGVVSGPVAFRLHDTHGFPIELTREIAAERGARVDEEGFAAAMRLQQEQSGQRKKDAGADEDGRLADLPGHPRARRPDPVRRLHRQHRHRPGARRRDRRAIDGRTADGEPRRWRSSSTSPRSTPRAAARSATPA